MKRKKKSNTSVDTASSHTPKLKVVHEDTGPDLTRYYCILHHLAMQECGLLLVYKAKSHITVSGETF